MSTWFNRTPFSCSQFCMDDVLLVEAPYFKLIVVKYLLLFLFNPNQKLPTSNSTCLPHDSPLFWTWLTRNGCLTISNFTLMLVNLIKDTYFLKMYVAESMMTVKFDANNFKIERQPVIVPNGCECQLTPPAIKGISKSSNKFTNRPHEKNTWKQTRRNLAKFLIPFWVNGINIRRAELTEWMYSPQSRE